MAYTKVTGALVGSLSDLDLTNVGDIQLDSISGDSDTNTSITFPGSDVMVFDTGGTERLRINSSGSVILNHANPEASSLLILDKGGNGSAALRFYNAASNTAALTLNSDENLVLEATNDIIIDSGGQNVYFEDDGTRFMSISQVSSDVYFGAEVSDKDMIFRVNDNGTTVTALTLDGSDAGRAIFTGSVALDSDSGQLQLGDDNDMQVYHNGSHGTINVGTGNLGLDIAGDLSIDADGGDIVFNDGGSEVGRFTNSSSDFVIKTATSDKDTIFKGNDGGSVITALTLDMSEAGKATFNSGVVTGGPLTLGDYIEKTSGNLTLDVAGNIILDADGAIWQFKDGGTEIFQINSGSQNANLKSTVQDKDIRLQGNDGGSTITALTLDMSEAGAAQFNSQIGVGAAPLQDAKLDLHTAGATAKPLAIRITNAAATNYAWEIWRDNTDGDLRFGEELGGTDTTRVTFESGGNVGIGTTSPGALLDIAGSANNDYPLKIRGNIDNSGGYTGIVFGYESDTTAYEKAAIHVEGTSGNVEPDFHILLHDGANNTNATLANAQKFSILNDGHLYGECLINSNVNPTGENSGKFWSTSGTWVNAWNVGSDPYGVRYFIELDIQGLFGYTSYGFIYKDRNGRWFVDLQRQAGTNVQVDASNTYIQVTQSSGATQTNSAGNVKLTRLMGTGNTAVS